MRREFLMLFGGLFAQAPRVATIGPKRHVVVVDAFSGELAYALLAHQPKPPNGQCPACGTMALSFKQEFIDGPTAIDWDATEAARKKDPTITYVVMKRPDKIPLYAAQLIRCAHCSNAFYQDAEVAK